MLFSPGSGRENSWLPREPIMKIIECSPPIESYAADGVELVPFAIFNGEEVLANALGINIESDNSNLLSNEKHLSNLNDVSKSINDIKRIELKSYIEVMKQHDKEAIDGIPIEKLPIESIEIETFDNALKLERAIIAKSSATEGYIIWLKLGDDVNALTERPNVLPNPDDWRSILFNSNKASVEGDTEQIIDEDEIDDDDLKPESAKLSYDRSIHDNISEKKNDNKHNKALLRWKAFKRGAKEMAAAAAEVLKLPVSLVSRNPDSNISIREATNNFKLACLTRFEENWYKSISTVERIIELQRNIVKDVVSRKWDLITLPEETEAQRRKLADLKEFTAKKRARVLLELTPKLTKKGHGEIDCNMIKLT